MRRFLVFVCAALAAAVASADSVAAQALFKDGKQAFQKGDFPTAATLFRKAKSEDPDLIEATWWCAATMEKQGAKTAALAAYRDFVALFEKKSAGASKEEQRLKALADKSIDALAVGERELKKIDDAYVASLLAFAKDQATRDVAAARRALDMVFAVRPDDADALDLAKSLGGAATKPAAPAFGGSFAQVKTWKDFVADHVIERPTITFHDDVMTVDAKPGAGGALIPKNFVDVGNAFAFESEFRLATAYQPEWTAGLAFAIKKGEPWHVAFATKTEVRIAVAKDRDMKTLASFGIQPIEEGKSFRRLGLVVRGPLVEAWMDGKKLGEWKEPSGADLVGQVGLFQQFCAGDLRTFRVGRLE